jgi:hypothetical protein
MTNDVSMLLARLAVSGSWLCNKFEGEPEEELRLLEPRPWFAGAGRSDRHQALPTYLRCFQNSVSDHRQMLRCEFLNFSLCSHLPELWRALQRIYSAISSVGQATSCLLR